VGVRDLSSTTLLDVGVKKPVSYDDDEDDDTLEGRPECQELWKSAMDATRPKT
jgi:hypothetical protein